MKKNKLFFLILLTNNCVFSMEQHPKPEPAKIDVQEAEQRYREKRDQVTQTYIGQWRTEEEKEKRFESLISETKSEVREFSSKVVNSDIWSLAYAAFSMVGGIVGAIECCRGSLTDLGALGTCIICGVSIVSGLCSYTNFCNICLARELKDVNQAMLKNYLEVKQLQPIQITVKKTS
jgi:hypothetical protein